LNSAVQGFSVTIYSLQNDGHEQNLERAAHWESFGPAMSWAFTGAGIQHSHSETSTAGLLELGQSGRQEAEQIAGGRHRLVDLIIVPRHAKRSVSEVLFVRGPLAIDAADHPRFRFRLGRSVAQSHLRPASRALLPNRSLTKTLELQANPHRNRPHGYRSRIGKKEPPWFQPARNLAEQGLMFWTGHVNERIWSHRCIEGLKRKIKGADVGGDEAGIRYVAAGQFYLTLKEQERTTRRSELEARFGMIRFQLRGDPVDAANYSRPEYWGEALAEEVSMTNAPAGMRSPGGFGRLGSLPLVVIRRGVKLPESELTGHPHRMTIAQIEQRRKEAHERLAGLSIDSVLLVAHKSGHNVNVEQPAIIVDAVKGVLAAVRQHIPLSQTFRNQGFDSDPRDKQR
jgi:hypothetical protein